MITIYRSKDFCKCPICGKLNKEDVNGTGKPHCQHLVEILSPNGYMPLYTEEGWEFTFEEGKRR